MAIVAIIPARYASTRFPGKPLAVIGGKPMIQWVWERVRQCKQLDRVHVATDDSRIQQTVEAFGGEVILTRADHPSGTDRLAEAADSIRLSDEDIIINVQGDEPLVEASMVTTLIRALEEAPESDMATLAVSSTSLADFENSNVVKVVVDRNSNALYFSRAGIPFRRDPDGGEWSFLKHLGFYGYRKKFLCRFTALPAGILEQSEKLEQLRALEHGHSIRVGLSPVDTVGVDTLEDLEKIKKSNILLEVTNSF